MMSMTNHNEYTDEPMEPMEPVQDTDLATAVAVLEPEPGQPEPQAQTQDQAPAQPQTPEPIENLSFPAPLPVGFTGSDLEGGINVPLENPTSKDYTRGTVYSIDPRLLRVDPSKNVRFRPPTTQDLADRAQSFAVHGQLQPIGVTRAHDGALEVCYGNTRTLAAVYGIANGILAQDWKIRYETVDAAKPPLESLLDKVAENAEHGRLTSMDYARVLWELSNVHGMKLKDAAARIGKKKAWASSIMALLKLPVEYQEDIHLGKMSAELGYDYLTTANQELAAKAMKALRKSKEPLTAGNFRRYLRVEAEAAQTDIEAGNGVSALGAEGDEVQDGSNTHAQVGAGTGDGKSNGPERRTKTSLSLKEVRQFWESLVEPGSHGEQVIGVAKAVLKLMDGTKSEKATVKAIKELLGNG